MPAAATKTFDAIVLGAGAAGMMCAAIAGSRGHSVLLIDHADRAGKKILISGGGRCNFTNVETSADRFLSQNPHFAKSALGKYQPQDFIDLVDAYKIAWHEKTLGQLFCDGSARQIVDMLQTECAKAGVTTLLGANISSVDHRDGTFVVATSQGCFTGNRLVVATGGPSIPKIGATGFAYKLAEQFNLEVVHPRPGLVPLTLGEDERDFGQLTGISADVVVTTAKTSFREAALFTHRGLSGPSILQVSSYWTDGDEITVNFIPEWRDGWLIKAKKKRPKTALATALAAPFSNRLAQILSGKLTETHALPDTLANIPDRQLTTIENDLRTWIFHPTGTEGFAKAEVTVGGISTAELSSKTMQVKKVPGLYVIGEAVDVTGWLGGYNFQWAWASGWACGQAM
ncbi:MAG: NAD(P)/FAD-dependent oxidoreductase [Filomicrobium sp.]